MKTLGIAPTRHRLAGAVLALGLLVAAGAARAQASPDFDAVAWRPIGCPAADLTADTSPSAVNFVGNATFPASYYAFDADYLYFRYRMDGDPSGPGGFAQYSWTALMQVPSGDPFQYQYQLSMEGQNDNVEIWANTVASDIDFSPQFQDDSEVRLFSQPYGTLARHLVAGDGSSFGNDPDYFVEFAFPVATLLANGVIADPAELAGSFFFPATSTNPNNYNKGHLNCSFLPTTDLAIDKTVGPSLVLANTATPLVYTVAVMNVGTAEAKGVVIEDIPLPAWMTNVSVVVASDDPSVTWTVVSPNPLFVKIPILPAGASVSVQIGTDASPTCSDADHLNVANTFATNAMDHASTAMVGVQTTDGVELCDGADNDCDGLVDENTDALCDDGDACNGAETCGGAAGCVAGTPPDCDDQNACTADACDPASGCTHTPGPGCTPCVTDADCNDGNACTTDSCTAGVCGSTPIPGCVSCATDADCADDGNACTAEACSAGACTTTPVPGCVPCATDTDCDDANACTTDACTAGACGSTPIPGCVPCTADADCNDEDICTTDACTDGACGHADIPGCVRPIPEAEVCGDCLDNDGDGLVDYEDPDCCAQPLALGVRRMKLKPAVNADVHGNRLRLRARYAPTAPPLFDPMTQDTTLQIADASGQMFCQTITTPHWKHPRARLYRFRDKKGLFAAGLERGKFKVRKNGQVVFRTRGKRMEMRMPDGALVTVTLRVGTQCSQATTRLRPKHKALVFP
jgi:uncharacterized repeat protein (TIGR01451 family)